MAGSNYVAYNLAQTRTDAEKLQARQNVGAAALASLAASFESRAPSYNWSVNEVCTYGGKLWMFDDDHSGAWTGADVHEIDVESLIGGGESDLVVINATADDIAGSGVSTDIWDRVVHASMEGKKVEVIFEVEGIEAVKVVARLEMEFPFKCGEGYSVDEAIAILEAGLGSIGVPFKGTLNYNIIPTFEDGPMDKAILYGHILPPTVEGGGILVERIYGTNESCMGVRIGWYDTGYDSGDELGVESYTIKDGAVVEIPPGPALAYALAEGLNLALYVDIVVSNNEWFIDDGGGAITRISVDDEENTFTVEYTGTMIKRPTVGADQTLLVNFTATFEPVYDDGEYKGMAMAGATIREIAFTELTYTPSQT